MKYAAQQGQAGQAEGIVGAPYTPYPTAASYQTAAPSQLAAVESEISYAARESDDALQMLQKTLQLLAGKLEPVLTAEVPQKEIGHEKAPQRSVSSQMANALMAHAGELNAVTYLVRNLLNRLAL